MNNKYITLSSFALFFSVLLLCAQPPKALVHVMVTPDHSDWTYEVGERAEFSITVLKNNVPIEEIEIHYHIQPEFLRCTATVEVDGKEYSSYATAGFLGDTALDLPRAEGIKESMAD